MTRNTNRALPHFEEIILQQLHNPNSIDHVAGLYGGAVALFLAQWGQLQKQKKTRLIVTAEAELAQQILESLRALDPSLRCELLPEDESTPYEAGRPERQLLLRRSAVLSALNANPPDFLVATVGSLLRKLPPGAEREKGGIMLQKGTTIELRTIAQQLNASGYQAVVQVEDPGTFCVRGDLLDIWPAGSPSPYRIESAFDEVETISAFDPDTQRKTPSTSLQELPIPPPFGFRMRPELLNAAKNNARALCDSLNLPSSKTRLALDDLELGPFAATGQSWLPAFFPLESVLRSFSTQTTVIWIYPDEVTERLGALLNQLQEERERRKDRPVYEIGDYYLSVAELEEQLCSHQQLVLHGLRISGTQKNQPLAQIGDAPKHTPHLRTEDQRRLSERLKLARKQGGRHAGLDPLVEMLLAWQDEDFTVVVSARVETQAERIRVLLEHRGLAVERANLDSILQEQNREEKIYIVVSTLSSGVIAEEDRIVLLTEEEIFGKRSHRASRSKKSALKNALSDLRSLKVGDLVVHAEHGIGRYLGLEHRQVGSSAVDLLVVEYQGGDKLFLPVYRLNQIQRLNAADGQMKMDRLGGLTFSKTKRSTKKKVREIADQLLKLYAERAAVQRQPLPPPGDEFRAFEAAFPFEETPDQAAAIQDVVRDLQRSVVMDRLVCGDVGFGKTEVALRAAYLNIVHGRQVALLCPTTILAEQHYRTAQQRLEGSFATIAVLSRFQSPKKIKETIQGLKAGTIDMVIGTHRLLSKDIGFKNLGLLVVDEEQRFGVTHKERVKELRRQVDVLTLSATPIPRTLSLSISGLRDMSVIATPPEARRAIRTVISRFDEELIRDAISREIGRGGQVYYVFNRVEGLYERAALLKKMMPELKVGVAHGQMKERELEKTMLGFVDGQFDVLVATTIIESGLDIPRANTMLIDRADLFGLSQLYQIRGRVGRSQERAFCYLMVPGDTQITDDARRRIEALERHTDLGAGFQIAAHDMELRGTGELLGADQSGFMSRVGFELFAEMLQEAAAELRGEEHHPDIDPDLALDVEALLPESYVTDIGLRLTLYKRYASAESEQDVEILNQEVQERFGPPPIAAQRFMAVMIIKTELRHLKATALNATAKSASLVLRADTPLDGARLAQFVHQHPDGAYSLSPDGRLGHHAHPSHEDSLAHAQAILNDLLSLLKKDSSSALGPPI